jgi:hypothetical protein
LLTLLVTALATAYFLVPELLYRYLFGVFLVRKNIAISRGEELVRGVFWAVVPLSIAWRLRYWETPLIHLWTMPDRARDSTKTVFAGLYTSESFSSNPGAFYHAITIFGRANGCLLARAYIIVAIGTLLSAAIAVRFGYLRDRGRSWRREFQAKLPSWLWNWWLPRSIWKLVAGLIYIAILPRISEWHVALSPMLLRNRERRIEVDVMTKSGTLYRGQVQQKHVGADGDLQCLILSSPARFLYDAFTKDREKFKASETQSELKKPKIDNYWRDIPGELFLIAGDDVASVNVRHAYSITSEGIDPELREILMTVKDALAKRRPLR